MRKFFFILALAAFTLPHAVCAQDSASTTTSPANTSIYTSELGGAANAAGVPTADQSILAIIGTFISALLGLLGVIFLILVIYAGILWMTAAGNGDQVKKAQHILRDGVIGLIIILSSYAISYAVLTYLNQRVY